MGEVYRARDTRLHRDVAIKVLLPAVAGDPDRLARFRREAQVLASLNHPNIAHIHGLEEAADVTALILEFVDGEDLSQRVARGPLPLDEAMAIARQIAEALEAAHAHGIIHRDLKPANIKLRADGTVKVLDFGLAKAVEPAPDGEPGSPELANSPTLSIHATRAGIILGTAAYMSPEQARGKHVDKRTDLWALGCVLFELLAGRRAFQGEDTTDTIIALATKEPEWSALPVATPAAVRKLLRRMLEKDPRRRLDSAAVARLEIDDCVAAPASEAGGAAPPATAGRRYLRIAWTVAAVGAVVAVAVPPYWLRTARDSASGRDAPIHLLLSEEVPAWTAGSERSFAISPDGRRIVYVSSSSGTPKLYLRDLSSVDASPIAGTDNALSPFFSRDGRQIGFFADGQIRVLPLAGGAPVILANAANARGAVWLPDDTIVYSPATDAGLWQVAASGGPPRLLAQPDPAKGERSYRWPEVLPGGDALLFTVGTSDILSFDDAKIAVRSMATGEQHEVLQGGSFATYAPTGELLYARDGAVLAVPFDARRRRTTGPPRTVLKGVVNYPHSGAAQFALSANGTLLYVSGKSESRSATLSWVSRSGAAEPLALPPAAYQWVTVSPDGRRAAVDIDAANSNIWILDLERTAMTRLTMAWSNNSPTWTPDGARIAFTSARGGVRGLFWLDVRAQDEQQPVFPLGRSAGPVGGNTWLPDGRTVIFDAASPGTGRDLWAVEVGTQGVLKPLLQTPFNESSPALSPNGRWLAYVSNETGRPEVYVQPYPGGGGKSRLSIDGGEYPLWANDGRDLFFRSGDAIVAVSISPSAGAPPGQPRTLFRTRSAGPFGLARDGRFLVIDEVPRAATARPITVGLNWIETLKARQD